MFTYFEKSWLKPDSTVKEEYKVKRWQELHGWGDWVDTFYTESVNKQDILRTLQSEDQKSMGMSKVGDRREFLTHVDVDFDKEGNSLVLSQHFPQSHSLTSKKTVLKPHPPSQDSNKPEYARTLRPAASRDRLEGKLQGPSQLQQNGSQRELQNPSLNGIQCNMCETENAVCHCTQCDEYFCEECDSDMHTEVGFKSHHRNPISEKEQDFIRKLGQQNAPMVRVLALKAAESNTSAIQKALGAEDEQSDISPLDTPMMSSTPSTVSRNGSGVIPLLNLGNMSTFDEDQDEEHPSPLKKASGMLSTQVTLEEDMMPSTPIRTPRMEGSAFVSPILLHTPMLSSMNSVSHNSSTPSRDHVSIGGISTSTRKSIMSPRMPANNGNNPGKSMLSPRGSILSSPRMMGSRASINMHPSNPLVSPTRGSISNLNHTNNTPGSNRGSILALNNNNNNNNTMMMSPTKDFVMTKEAQQLIAKTKEDAVQATKDADAAGVQVAKAKAKREMELKEIQEAEVTLERKKAIANIAARRADDSVEARNKAENAQKEVLAAMEVLERERRDEEQAAEEERIAMKKVEIAFAKQFHAKTMATQAVQMEHMVAKPTRTITADEVTVRIQMWLWDPTHKRAENAQPAVCVEFPYKELVEFKLLEAQRDITDEDMEDEDDQPIPVSASGNKVALLPIKGAKKPVDAKKPAAKKAAPRVDKAEAAFESLKSYVCKRLHASVQHMRATAVPELVKQNSSLDFGRDPTSKAVDVPSKSIVLTQMQLDNNTSGLVSLPSLQKTKGLKATAAANANVEFPQAAVEKLEWTHPVLGTSFTNFSQIAEVAPTPSQQLHHNRNKPEVFDATEDEAAIRHAGVSALPLTYQYRLDATECMQQYHKQKSTGEHGELQNPQYLRKLEQTIPMKRWKEDKCQILPVDIVFTPPSTSVPKIPGVNSVGSYRFNWAEHCYKDEQQRLVRLCRGCKRYFSDDVNHGSGCRKHNERSTNILEHVKNAVVPTTEISKVYPELCNTSMVLHACCGNNTCKLKNPPHQAVISSIPPEQYACDLNGGLITGEEEEVVSDDEEPVDMDLALELAEEEEDIVGFSTAPSAVRHSWEQLYPNEAPIGCAPCRHEGNIYLPLRMRTQTVAELKIRRHEAKRQERLAVMDVNSTSQTQHLQEEVNQLAKQMVEGLTKVRTERKITIAIFEEVGKERISKKTGIRQDPQFTFVYNYGLGEVNTLEQWESNIFNPVISKYTSLNPSLPRRLCETATLHCPFTLMHVTDQNILESLHTANNTLDLILCLKHKSTDTLKLAMVDKSSICTKYAQLRNPVGAVKLGTSNESNAAAHWSNSEKGDCVRTCRICGELFQNTSTVHAEDDLDYIDSLLYVGCAKYDLIHPSNSSIFIPFTTNLGYANTVRKIRDKITKLDLQIRKVSQLHDITNNLVKAYDEYASHNNTYHGGDHNNLDDDDDDDPDVLNIDGNAQDTGDLWSGQYEDDEIDMVDGDIHLLQNTLCGADNGRLTCCNHQLQKQMVYLGYESGKITANSNINERVLNSVTLQRGWRLLPFIDLPQTPKQAAEVAMQLKERDRSNILVQRVFDDNQGKKKRGCGDTPSFTVVVRMGRSMSMSLIRYRVFKAWCEEGNSGEKYLDWRTEVTLRHPVTGQQFSAVDSTDLSHLETKLVAHQVACARMYAHLHTQDLEELPNTYAGITNTVGVGKEALNRPDLLSTRFAYRYSPMIDLYGPPVALLDWADSYGRIDVILSVNTAAMTRACVEPPKFLELFTQPSYKYYNDTTLPGSVIASSLSPKSLQNPTPLVIRSMHQARLTPYLHFSANLAAPTKITSQLTREVQKHNAKNIHHHAWPQEQIYAARICATCDQVFCLAMYLDDKYKDMQNVYCSYHPKKIVNGTFPCCNASSAVCTELPGCLVIPDQNNMRQQIPYTGEKPCVQEQHRGHFMYPLRYFLPPKY